MVKSYIAKASVSIDAGVEEVWNALVDPKMIARYMFGTEARSEWKKGSPITYRGVWEGKPYEDKGTILEIVPGRLLVSTYWSSMSGRPDEPANYATVTYEIAKKDGKALLSVTQDNNPSEESAKHSEGNWGTVLTTLKKILEE